MPLSILGGRIGQWRQSSHPAGTFAKPLHHWKCGYVPLSVLYTHQFGSLHIWSNYRTMCLSSSVDEAAGVSANLVQHVGG